MAAKAQAESSSPYEQEAKLDKLFNELQTGFKKMEGVSDPNKQTNLLKDLTNKMQEAKRCAQYAVSSEPSSSGPQPRSTVSFCHAA